MKMTQKATTLQTLNTLIFQRQYRQAEQTLLAAMSAMLDSDEQSTEDVQLIQALYANFNEQYLDWVMYNGFPTDKEIRELGTDEHYNFLLGRCTDASSMDDLMYELSSYLTDRHTQEQKGEAEYHLICYKKMLHGAVHRDIDDGAQVYQYA